MYFMQSGPKYWKIVQTEITSGGCAIYLKGSFVKFDTLHFLLLKKLETSEKNHKISTFMNILEHYDYVSKFFSLYCTYLVVCHHHHPVVSHEAMHRR